MFNTYFYITFLKWSKMLIKAQNQSYINKNWWHQCLVFNHCTLHLTMQTILIKYLKMSRQWDGSKNTKFHDKVLLIHVPKLWSPISILIYYLTFIWFNNAITTKNVLFPMVIARFSIFFACNFQVDFSSINQKRKKKKERSVACEKLLSTTY